MSATCTSRVIPALLTRTSTAPKAAATCSKKAATDGFVRDIAAAGPRPPAARDDCGLEFAGGLLTIAKGNADRRTALRQQLRDRAADAARASSDDRNAAGQTQCIGGDGHIQDQRSSSRNA